MKRYPQIIAKLFYQPLVITQAKHAAIVRALEAHIARADHDEPDGDEDPELIKEALPPKPDWQTFGPDAVIPVHGILGKHLDGLEMMSGGCDLDRVVAMMDVAEADEEVKKIIFDFRTPGGEVTGIPEAARRIYECTKTTVAFTDSECCSGGVWLASQCEAFYCTSSSSVGSIGVWTAYMDVSRQLANEGQNMQSVHAGKFKLMGAYWKPLTDEEKARIQADVDKIYAQFTSAVNLRREVSLENMQGQIFDGEDAVQAGICDGNVESIEELLYQPKEEETLT